MFIHLKHGAQTVRIAETLRFLADNRDEGTQIHVSDTRVDPDSHFAGCLVVETKRQSAKGATIISDRQVVAPDGSILHLS